MIEGDDGDNKEREEEDNNEAEEREKEPAREGPRTLRDRSKIQTSSWYRHNANIAEYIESITYEEATNSTEAAQ